ncbi:transglutaminase-like domain-containing protein [Patescibacteria group bacterium]
MLKKYLLVVFFSLFVLFILPKNVLASGEFIIDSEVSYIFTEDGKAKVIHKNTLENSFPTLYAKSYTLKLENINAQKVKAFDNNGNLKVNENNEGDIRTIDVKFEDTLLGKGAKREFTIEYDITDLADRTGNVWEIIIPKLQKDSAYRNYEVEVITPKAFGDIAYISPDPKSKSETTINNVYIFTKESLIESSISMGFGEFQVFDYSLNYHLENPLNDQAETEIAVPPDTAFQKVFILNVEPKPENIRLDDDGNWIAKYILKPRERIDVALSGVVQIFAQPKDFIKPTKANLDSNLLPSAYWQTYDEKIKSLSKSLSNPTNIYSFVTKKLVYDYERVKPNVERLGAVKALQSPENAICMEYTDLFITLARASGIPAREINGYAYTENPDIQPMSLVSDVLHSWPEYWDKNKELWIPIDPTWGSTTGGLDFFNKLDLRHFTFVIHGTDPSKPYAPGSFKLGPNPQKDVFVSFGKLPVKRESHVEITSKQSKLIPIPNIELDISIKNNGPVAIYTLRPEIYFNNEIQKVNEIEYLLPFSDTSLNLSIPFSFLALNTPDEIKVAVNSSEIVIKNIKSQVIIFSLVLLFIPIVLILSVIIIRSKILKRKEVKNKSNEYNKANIKKEIIK